MTEREDLVFRNEQLHREVERLRLDLEEAGKERDGLLAALQRAREQAHSLAAQITGVVP